MNATELLAMYERVADAPDAVEKLRRFVLDLAVRGKLVEQDPRPVLQGTHGAFAPGSSGELFEIPDGWRWATLSDLGTLRGGGTPSKARPDFWGGTIPWVSPKDMKRDYLESAQMSVTESALAGSAANLIPAGSVLFVVRGMILAHSFPVGIATVPLTINQDMKALVLAVPEQGEYLLRALKGMKAFMLKRVQRSSHGTCRIEGSDYSDFPVPIPPLAEQHRIVTKVDELMTLCDQLDAARSEREAARDRLAAASLARLKAPEPDTFLANVRFALNVLPALGTRPDQVKQLRQSILNLAVRGVLVPQSRDEQLARVPDIDFAADVERRLDFDLPNGWRWVRVQDVAEARLGKMLDKAKNKGRPYPYLRNTNVHWFDIRLDDLKTIPLGIDDFDVYRLEPQDVLICEGGHGIGRTAVWRGELTNVVFQKALHRVRPGSNLHPDYFAMCSFVYFDAGIMQAYFTGVGIPHFTGRALAQLVFPLPPIGEQHRIVAKVNELMVLCDQLEASLADANYSRSRLLESLLHHALESTTGAAKVA